MTVEVDRAVVAGWRAQALTTDAAAWDDEVSRQSGHLLQSWRWGEFKSLHGWSVKRVAVGGAAGPLLAQILFRGHGPLSLAYIPRGPVANGASSADLRMLFRAVDDACRARRAVQLIVEPNEPLSFCGTFKQQGFVKGPDHFQPARTVKVPLLDDEPLLTQMHQKTRYSVRLAYRRGVTFDRLSADEATIDTFYGLLRDTSDRNAFGIHSREYYQTFLQVFGDDAIILFALVDGIPAAALISARFGREAIYMYGASSTEHRAHGGAFALQFEAMKWARSAGSSVYDLWGIPAEDPVSTTQDNDRVAGTKGDDWRGLFKFKTGFGGEIVSYPPTLERRYRPLLSFAARRVYAKRGV